MEIDAEEQLAAMSVGEFSRFSTFAPRGDALGLGAWRAAVGQHWHQEVQKQAAASAFQNEYPISGDVRWRHWTLRLRGRIDQIRIEQNLTHVREIKTVAATLPMPALEISRLYRDYCIQLLAYRELLKRSDALPDTSEIQLELYLIEIATGVTQSLALDERFDSLIVDRLDSVADYLDSKRERLARLRSLRYKPAYTRPRPGQETIQSDLENAFGSAPVTLLEAPTGFGKTGVSWEFALGRLASGQFERLLYLTSKKTGQLEAMERLNALLSDGDTASYWQIRSKAEHCVNTEFRCSPKTCPYLDDLDEKWDRRELQPLFASHAKPEPIETVKAMGAAAGVCPYEAMRATLGYRDIWIADYNYVFSPGSGQLLDGQPDFDPAKTFLIIDEAHNLPSRIESNLSVEIRASLLGALENELGHIGASRRLRRILAHLSDECLAYDTDDVLSLSQLEDIADSLVSMASILASEPMPYEDLHPDSLDSLWALVSVSSRLKEQPHHYVGWIRETGVVRVDCIDASSDIAKALAPFGQSLFLSATLGPIDNFIEQCGLNTAAFDPKCLRPSSPWLEGAYDVAIDTRVDTRFTKRESSAAKTAETIDRLASHSTPVAVFFPSYAYAERIASLLQAECPFYRIATQSRRLSESVDERAAFIDEALRYHDILFLTLGSSFSEGVDMIGGKIPVAMVVSPALPEVNPAQQYRREYFEKRGDNGFERAYLQPGIRKVNQALGRLVRGPGQTVKVLLHCQRFAEPRTRALLASQYQNFDYIMNDQDLADWIEV